VRGTILDTLPGLGIPFIHETTITKGYNIIRVRVYLQYVTRTYSISASPLKNIVVTFFREQKLLVTIWAAATTMIQSEASTNYRSVLKCEFSLIWHGSSELNHRSISLASSEFYIFFQSSSLPLFNLVQSKISLGLDVP
jgi:hypothetical protein